MHTVYLNIGSNQGDRRALIERAVALIASSLPQARVRLSQYVESEPWGYDSPNPFLNLGVALDLESMPSPLKILRLMQGIERQVGKQPHRNPDGSYRDRDIDIDIIAIDLLRLRIPGLTIPHPRAALRRFVMQPLAELAPPEVIAHVAPQPPEGEDSSMLDHE